MIMDPYGSSNDIINYLSKLRASFVIPMRAA